MGTSQSAVARIESGDDNITLGKLKRLVGALRGRIRFAIEPEEMGLPQWPHWTTLVEGGLGAPSDWSFKAAELRPLEIGSIVVAAWFNDHTEEPTTTVKELAESAQAS